MKVGDFDLHLTQSRLQIEIDVQPDLGADGRCE